VTRRTKVELDTLFADNTTGDISPEDVRDLTESVYAGGLVPNAQTVTTAGITGAVGQLYVCTIAGLTANRDVTLPSATAGDKMGVYVADGDDTYALVLKGAASQTINGGSAATEWSRVFIKGEIVVFVCVAADTWIVLEDGRIPCQCKVTLSAAVTTNTAGTAKVISFDTESYDIGDIYDHASNKYMTCRRAGKYSFDGFIFPNAAFSDQKYYGAYLYNDVVASFTKSYSVDLRRNSTSTGSTLATCAFIGQDTLAVGDKVVPVFLAEEVNIGVVHTQASAPHKFNTFFAATELL
jgi:hypothetical protein